MIIPIHKIPIVNKNILSYILEDMKLSHKENELWLEFGVGRGNSINYISKFTQHTIYGFDSFNGLPEKWRKGFDKGFFSLNGTLPKVNNNVKLVEGLFDETLIDFLNSLNKKISFMHIDCDLYSSTKYVLNHCYNFLASECIIVFDELINYPEYYLNGELSALSEWVDIYNPTIDWIATKGEFGSMKQENQAVAIKVKI